MSANAPATGAPELIVVMRASATPEEVRHVVALIEEAGAGVHVDEGGEGTVIGAIGDRAIVAGLPLEALEGVERVVPLRKEYKRVSREFRSRDTVVAIGPAKVGGGNFAMMAGPCSIETYEQTLASAQAVKAAGGAVLRGGAYKPRTSPYAFQGLGVEGLWILRRVGDEVGLPVTTELMDARDLADVVEHVDMIWIGARNMQNFNLLSEVGRSGKPVMLKRGMSATVEELLMAAEYVAKGGCDDVILCERGIRTFEKATRFTLDVSAIPVLKAETHLPVIVDPSHAAGKRSLVLPLALAAVAAGADGLIVETHPTPEHALSDAAQQIPSAEFGAFVQDVERLVQVSGRTPSR
ncbi:MAG: 3-deoxy-7-phosphoheptulonate synthase [Actinomycetota bacterium]